MSTQTQTIKKLRKEAFSLMIDKDVRRSMIIAGLPIPKSTLSEALKGSRPKQLVRVVEFLRGISKQ